jgi:hypothetical protein
MLVSSGIIAAKKSVHPHPHSHTPVCSLTLNLGDSPSKLTSFDRELTSEPNTTIFRLNTGHRANPDKKYNIFMYKKWVKNRVFRPKLHFLLDDPYRNWHHSIENQILHLTQATRKLTQVMERIRTRKT